MVVHTEIKRHRIVAMGSHVEGMQMEIEWALKAGMDLQRERI